ncbi:MAG: Gfo/Idh/MocA family oxidoreductase [Planctomycetes bacterium]|nr:Gfo/Idh/MocA family oxidoreductase [Planctomycetota bacterium]
MGGKFKWGIIGPGNIAKKFATGLKEVADAELYAVASRDKAKAENFIGEFGGAKAYGSYEEMLADPEVQAVYISTPHVFHKDNSMQCIRAGKAVLCEKPMTVNASEAQEVFDAAEKAGVLYMEAMWTRFLPIMERVRKLVAEGAIGEVRMLTADFGFRCGWNPESRLLNPALAGGGLLDVGIYPISFFSMLFGEPVTVQGTAHIGKTGVDEQAAWVFGYDEGRIAIGYSAVQTSTPHEAYILGTEGRIHIHAPWWVPSRMTVSKNGADPEEVTLPPVGNGYNYEAQAVMDSVRKGELEHPLMTHAESLQIMKTMDKLRAQWGLKYPVE